MKAPHLEKGDAGENAACDYLRAKGWTVLDRNWRAPMGELDLVVKKGDVLAFVEVKARDAQRGSEGFTPEDAMTPHKQVKMARTARAWLLDHEKEAAALWPRLDVITVRGVRVVEHLEDAFEARGG